MKALQQIQSELKAPKGQLNKFGGYKYRSCEDILEALKPLLAKHNAVVLLSDDIVLVGSRFYVKATATFKTAEESISVTAFAREAETKKGMDESQITGSASSYARKYALNGLFGIDDTKDADTMDNRSNGNSSGSFSKQINSATTMEELDKIINDIKAKMGDSFSDIRDSIVPLYAKKRVELNK